jgi:hypothetical protein
MNYRSLVVLAVIAAPLAFAPGCAPERHEVVPSSAILGAEGNQRLTFTSDGPGTIYIVDQSDDKLLYSGHVTSRRQVVVDPEENQITVDGQLVQDKSLRPGHNRKIFFRPTVR